MGRPQKRQPGISTRQRPPDRRLAHATGMARGIGLWLLQRAVACGDWFFTHAPARRRRLCSCCGQHGSYCECSQHCRQPGGRAFAATRCALAKGTHHRLRRHGDRRICGLCDSTHNRSCNQTGSGVGVFWGRRDDPGVAVFASGQSCPKRRYRLDRVGVDHADVHAGTVLHAPRCRRAGHGTGWLGVELGGNWGAVFDGRGIGELTALVIQSLTARAFCRCRIPHLCQMHPVNDLATALIACYELCQQ